MSRPKRTIIYDIGQPEGLVSERGLVGPAYNSATRNNTKLWTRHYCLHARRVVSGREVPRCCWPVVSPTEGPDDQVCGITDPDMLSIDHVNDDGKADRLRWKTSKAFNVAILSGERGREGLQILCANHNQKKNVIFAGTTRNSPGRPQCVSDEQIRMTLGLSQVEAARQCGVTRNTISRRRRELLDFPQETMVD